MAGPSSPSASTIEIEAEAGIDIAIPSWLWVSKVHELLSSRAVGEDEQLKCNNEGLH